MPAPGPSFISNCVFPSDGTGSVRVVLVADSPPRVAKTPAGGAGCETAPGAD